jgi:low affinity Fe/Cu permease
MSNNDEREQMPRWTAGNARIPEAFRRFAHTTAELTGSAWAFLLALLTIVVWGCSGPYFRFSDTWQLVINTSTTIITFLMVFLIQNMQNRDAREIHLKLDELIRSHKQARNDFIHLEQLSDAELKRMAELLTATRQKRSITSVPNLDHP